MKKVWSFSTAVRNPDRIRGFLKTLSELKEKSWDQKTQLEFQARLIKNRLYGYKNSQFYNNLPKSIVEKIDDPSKNLTLDEAFKIIFLKKYKDPAMRGRQSFKPLEKMGLATIRNKKIFITSLGEYFLSSDYDLGELFFKSFLKWQYPNPLDKEFKDKNIYNIRPFLGTLHLINEVNRLCEKNSLKAKGISKIEFEIFVPTLLNAKDIPFYAKEILSFRKKYESIKSFKEKKDFIDKFKKEFLKEFSNTNNLKDYADNIIRYFRLTRYIYIRGGGFYIDLEPKRKIQIKSLLKNFKAHALEFDKERFLEYISDINTPKLPWQNEKELLEIKQTLILEIKKLGEFDFSKIDKIKDLNKQIAKLKEVRDHFFEKKVKKELLKISEIEKTIYSLENIKNLDLKPSIALEKYITYFLYILNQKIIVKPNSLKADDGEFIYTAPANKPDIECFYDDFNFICEVTMLTSKDQWFNEGQPVMRHLRDFEKRSNKKNNFCLFVAPAFHRDTLNTFWISVKYEYEGKRQKIIPILLSEIVEILKMILNLLKSKRSFLDEDFKDFINKLLLAYENSTDSIAWRENISKNIKEFLKAYR